MSFRVSKPGFKSQLCHLSSGKVVPSLLFPSFNKGKCTSSYRLLPHGGDGKVCGIYQIKQSAEAETRAG